MSLVPDESGTALTSAQPGGDTGPRGETPTGGAFVGSDSRAHRVTCSPLYVLTASCVHPFACSPRHVLIASRAHRFACSLRRLLTASCAHRVVCSPHHVLIASCDHRFTCSPRHVLIASPAHRVMCSPRHVLDVLHVFSASCHSVTSPKASFRTAWTRDGSIWIVQVWSRRLLTN